MASSIPLDAMPRRARELFAVLGLRFDPEAVEPLEERRSDTRQNGRFAVTVETRYWQQGDGELTALRVDGDNGATDSRAFELWRRCEAHLTVSPWGTTLSLEGGSELTSWSVEGPRADALREAWVALSP